ncbi:MAG: aminotransferase class I/II-fold pyridoxal phosphate-dependent enzyme, partial [Pseudomonadota bacterium]
PGGSGALFVALRTIKVMAPDARIWISRPCWPNHIAMAERLGFETLFYTYKSTPEGAADLALVEADLDAAKPGDVLLLQGACHNPTGTDFTDEAWVRLAELAREKGFLPFIDVAYQGFGNGLEEDVVGVRRFLEAVPEAIVTYSCSKNFGLYRERVGALVFQAAHADAAERVASHAAIAVRTSFSMPPAHGPAIVAKILGDQALRGIWTQELTAMTDRLRTLRVGFTDALAAATGRNSFQSLARENGMFAILPISKENVEQVRKEHGIYMPSSGRINIAGLKEDRLKEVAEKLGPYLSPAD